MTAEAIVEAHLVTVDSAVILASFVCKFVTSVIPMKPWLHCIEDKTRVLDLEYSDPRFMNP